jgi:hypothetical protein
MESPAFQPEDCGDVADLDALFARWFELEERIRSRGGDFCDTQVDHFPEPMLRSWLRVLQWWWSGDRDYLDPLQGTRLEASALVAVQPPAREMTFAAVTAALENGAGRPPRLDAGFSRYVVDLHTEKHEAYGDSWKRRGEMLGIMANIARKIDRLDGGETRDETSADTAIDLLVYLAKYRWWLFENADAPCPVTRDVGPYHDPYTTNALIRLLDAYDTTCPGRSEEWLARTFDQLEKEVMAPDPERWQTVDQMLPVAYGLAHRLWSNQ